VQGKLKIVAKDPIILEPRPVRAWETTTVPIEIPYHSLSPALALRDTNRMAFRFLANTTPLPESAAV
jgi:hypothetical protein